MVALSSDTNTLTRSFQQFPDTFTLNCAIGRTASPRDVTGSVVTMPHSDWLHGCRSRVCKSSRHQGLEKELLLCLKRSPIILPVKAKANAVFHLGTLFAIIHYWRSLFTESRLFTLTPRPGQSCIRGPRFSPQHPPNPQRSRERKKKIKVSSLCHGPVRPL